MNKREALKAQIELLKCEFNELTESEKLLVKNCIEAATDAYAPYSKFKVGAAALLENGKMVKGSNQENAAYPSGLCAERVALFSCGANFKEQKITHLSVYVESFKNENEVPMPCGGCRQVINQSEFRQNQSIKIMLVTKNKDVYIAENSEQLLPFPFRF
ncbi:MAG: cytidine deaminase [Bacteroidia bacterium]